MKLITFQYLIPTVLGLLEVSLVMVEHAEWRDVGAYVINDCNVVMFTKRRDQDQDAEVYQDDWKLTWWKDDGVWENITISGPNSFKEELTLNKSPHITNTDISKFTDFGVACSNGNSRDFCEKQQSTSFNSIIGLF